jgi:hypothetical protein
VKARGSDTRPATARKMANAAEFAAKVAPVAREIGGSYRYIAAQLNERSVATAQGQCWHAINVNRVMARVR